MQGRVLDRFCASSEAVDYLTARQKEGAGTPTTAIVHILIAMPSVQAAHARYGGATPLCPLTQPLLGGTVRMATGETPLTSEPGDQFLTFKVSILHYILQCIAIILTLYRSI